MWFCSSCLPVFKLNHIHQGFYKTDQVTASEVLSNSIIRYTLKVPSVGLHYIKNKKKTEIKPKQRTFRGETFPKYGATLEHRYITV